MKDVEKTAEIYLNELWLKNQPEWSKIEDDLLILGTAKYSIDKDGNLTRLNPLSDDELIDGLIVEDTKVDLSRYTIGIDPIEYFNFKI